MSTSTARAFEVVVHDGFPVDLVSIIVPVATFVMVVAIVVAALYFRFRTQTARQDLVRSYLERGQEVPASLIEPPAKPQGDLRRGLVLLAGGIGTSVAMAIAGERQAAGLGFIPAFIGVAFLVVWRLEGKGERDRANG